MTTNVPLHALSWSVRGIGARTLLVWCLLFVIFGSVIIGLDDIVRGLESTTLVYVFLIGTSVGWGMAKSRLNGRWALILSAFLGLVVSILLAGRLSGKFQLLLRFGIQLGWEHLGEQLFAGKQADTSLISPILGDLARSLDLLLGQVKNWILATIQHRAAYDLVVTTLLWNLALWGSCVWAGWAIRRYARPLVGIAPAVILFASTSAFVGASSLLLLPVLGGSLFLIAVITFQAVENNWISKHIDFPEDIRLDIVMISLVLIAGLLFLAWGVSILPTQKILAHVGRLINRYAVEESPLSESLGLERQQQDQGAFSGVGSGGKLPRGHLIGSGPELSQQLVMLVSIQDEFYRAADLYNGTSTNRYYWKSLTYDVYTGNGWTTSPTVSEKYKSGELFSKALKPNHRLAVQEIQMFEDQGDLLYTSGDLVTSDRDFEVANRTSRDGIEDIFGASIIQKQFEDSLRYSTTSQIPTVGEDKLHQAGENYPQWVIERYISLPESVPGRVLELAAQVTDAANTPYERALAIEEYLHGYPYTLDLPQPPQEVDIADYFLFDLGTGFCDYYATAMVVLLRATGVPARLAIGYASGTHDETHDRFIVTEADAHSWVEVFFPDIGWVAFEPTAGRPAIQRPEMVELSDIPLGDIFGAESNLLVQLWGLQLWGLQWIGLIGISLAIFVTVLLTWSFGDRWKLGRMTPQITVRKIYQRLYRRGHRLSVSLKPGNTPNEFADALGKMVSERSRGSRFQKSLSPAAAEISHITYLYTQSVYSHHPVSESDQAQVIHGWQRLRWKLWLVRYMKRRRKLAGKEKSNTIV